MVLDKTGKKLLLEIRTGFEAQIFDGF